MEPLKPEILELLILVQQKYDKPLRTTTDFEEFSFHLARHSGIDLSPSTIKRLWGYVNDQHAPRLHTLDKLARYINYSDFDAFCAWLRTSTRYNSSFFSTSRLQADSLTAGTQVHIGWAPDRHLLLEYLGNNEFQVIEAHASKLLAGDRFPAPYIYKDFPLYLPWVEREGNRLSPFVAGRNGGITIMEIINNK